MFRNGILLAALLIMQSLLYSVAVHGQASVGVQTQPNTELVQLVSSQRNLQFQAGQKPYRVTSRLHIFAGTTKGYLVVQVDLAKGKHIYSLTQKGALQPTKIEIAKSNQFRVLNPFSSDRPAKVIANDPVLGQRVEKHEGTIQFFAPVEISAGVNLSQFRADIVVHGQICGNNGCELIKNEKAIAKFAGYMKAPVQQPSKNR